MRISDWSSDVCSSDLLALSRWVSRLRSTRTETGRRFNSLNLDRPVRPKPPAAPQRPRIIGVGQRRDRLPIVGTQACRERGVVAEWQEDAALGHIFGAKPGVDQRVGIEREADRRLFLFADGNRITAAAADRVRSEEHTAEL